MLFWALSLLCIIVIILLCIFDKPCEKFTTKPRKINVACLYAAYDITQHDVDFIRKYAKDIPFYVVNNGGLSIPGKELQKMRNVKVITRKNKGYDTGAWKFGMQYYKGLLNRYDMIIFMNNSCVIGADLLRLCEHAIDYDLYSYGFSYELYRKPYDTPHLHAYLFFVNKRLYQSADFKEHWDKISANTGNHDDSVNHNEYQLKPFFESRGYKVGAYTFLDVEDTYKYVPNSHYSSEIIKKRELKVYPEKINDFNVGINNNRRQGY